MSLGPVWLKNIMREGWFRSSASSPRTLNPKSEI